MHGITAALQTFKKKLCLELAGFVLVLFSVSHVPLIEE